MSSTLGISPSCRSRSVLQVFLSSEREEGYFKKFFDDDKCYGESMSEPRNNKNFEFDSGKMLRITHVGDRNLTESRIYPKAEFDRMPNVPKFRSVD